MTAPASEETTRRRLGVLNIGFTRYRLPLDPHEAKKFSLLATMVDLHVVGLDTRRRFARRSAEAEFYLVPLVPLAGLRFALVFARSLVVGVRLLGKRRLDAVLSEGPYEALAGWLLARFARLVRRERVLLVTEVHGDWEGSPFLYRRIPLRPAVSPLLRFWSRFVLRRSDLVRTVSAELRERIAAIVPAAPCFVFPTYTDLDLFLRADDESAVEDAAEPRVAYVGQLTRLKGVDILLDAVERLVDDGVALRLVLVGEGPERERLERRIARGSLAGRVELAGRRTPEEVRAVLQTSRLLVLPSLSEGLPRVVLEAMACARPVVASDVGSVREVVEEGTSGFLVPPGDAGALADRIRRLVDRPERAEAMGRAARRLVEEKYSAASYANGYRALFDEAARRLAREEQGEDGPAT